jgi:hypothetical protein
MLMRNHVIVKLVLTPFGAKRKELELLESLEGKLHAKGRRKKQDDPSKTEAERKEKIKILKAEVAGNTDPDYLEVAIVPPTQDYFVRNAKKISTINTIREADSVTDRFDNHSAAFYENFDLVTEMVCEAVRDPTDINRHLIVPDDVDPDENQLRISEWNIPIDIRLLLSQGFISILETPTDAVVWIIFKFTNHINYIHDPKKRKQEDNEDIDTFPEDTSELAEGVEDPSVAGSSELPQRPLGPGPDDPGTSEIEDRHKGVRASPEGDQEIEP